MPINTVRCTACGNRIHYSIFDENQEQELVCTRCGAVNTVGSSDLEAHVYEEIQELKERAKHDREIAEGISDVEGSTFRKSTWTPGSGYQLDQDEDLDTKIDRIREKFRAAKNELSDVVGDELEYESTEDLVNKYSVNDIDLTVDVTHNPYARSSNKAVTFMQNKAIGIIADRYLDGDTESANSLYSFITLLYKACKEQNLDITEISKDYETVYSYAQKCRVNENVLELIDEMFRDGTMNKIVSIAGKYIK